MSRINGVLISDDAMSDFIRAWMYDLKDSNDRFLDVAISTVVDTIEDPSDCCAPVLDLLETVCAFENEWKPIVDPAFFRGKAQESTFRIYEECPGSSVDHLCVFVPRPREFTKLKRQANGRQKTQVRIPIQ